MNDKFSLLKRMRRLSGILVHPTSLPGKFGIGDLGPEAYRFVDFLQESGQHLWQTLPLGPTGGHNSPYQCFSSFAGQPLLISPELLKDEGLLTDADLSNVPHFSDEEVDFAAVGEYKEELLVLSETVIDKKIKNKYIISGNKNEKNVSIVFIIKDKVNNNLVNYLNSRKVNANFFIEGNYLSKNIVNIKELASNHSIYYLGTDGKYSDKYMIYNNNLININTKNESNYCITDKKDEKLLKLCTDYDMKTIKADYIENNILDTIKNNLTNGEIIVFNSEDEEEIKISINYILSKGYNIVSLNNLLNESNNCK